MTGERDLKKLLTNMAPELDPARYAFLTVPAGALRDIESLMRFSESEGDTLIVAEDWIPDTVVDDGRRYRRITLAVHSSLDAVGLTAAFASRLTLAGISANVVAGYFHDHIFVPEADAEVAMDALESLTASS